MTDTHKCLGEDEAYEGEKSQESEEDQMDAELADLECHNENLGRQGSALRATAKENKKVCLNEILEFLKIGS